MLLVVLPPKDPPAVAVVSNAVGRPACPALPQYQTGRVVNSARKDLLG